MPEYREGQEAKETFEKSMKALFQAPKTHYNPQNCEGRNSKHSQKTALGQELERFDSFRPRPCLRLVWRITLARQFAVRQPMPRNKRHSLNETIRWSNLVPKRVLREGR